MDLAPQKKSVTLPDGTAVTLIEMTGRVRDRIRSAMRETETDDQDFLYHVIAETATNGGAPVFASAAAVAEAPWRVLKELEKAAINLNGLGASAEKN